MLGQLPVSAAGHWGAPWSCKGQSLRGKKEQVAPAPCLSLSRTVLYTGLCPVYFLPCSSCSQTTVLV